MPNWKKVIVSGSDAILNSITGSGGIQLPDQARINFGNSNDLKIYHSGTHSIIQDTGTGDLQLKGSAIKIRGTATGESIAHFTENAGVELYYDNSKKLDVVTGGVDVTGTIQASGNISGSSTSTGSFGRLHVPGSDILIGNESRDASITFSSTNTYRIFSEFHSDRKFKIHDVSDGVTRLTIDTDGNVGIGTTTPGVKLHVVGHISGSQISSSGDIVADGDVIAYNSSDIRLKDNIEVIQGSLDKIGGIRGVEFDWNEKSPGWARERGHDIGVIAQEVQKVVPEIVVERKNGYLGVDYKRLVPLLIESVKELRQEVNDLKKKVS